MTYEIHKLQMYGSSTYCWFLGYMLLFVFAYSVHLDGSMGKRKLLPMSISRPRLDHIFHSARPHPIHASSTTQSSYPHMHGNSSPLGTNVTIPGHLGHQTHLTCEGTPSINLK